MKSKLGTLIIFSGLPGSGKSTLSAQLASILGATYLRIDTIEQGLKEICEISQVDGKAYRLAYRIAQENLQIGNLVIADSVNPWELTRNEWNEVAEQIGASFINIEVICADREEHRKRVESRSSSVPGLKLPTWEEVVKRGYQPWTSARVQLDTSEKNVDQCLAELIVQLESRGISTERENLK